jgi:rhodanese-related sulfurtransferase
MKFLIRLLCASLALGLPATSFAYDATLAEHLHKDITSQRDQKFFVEKSITTSAEDVLKSLSKNENITLLDIRTQAEQNVVGLTHPNSLSIPMEKLLLKENLDRLPEQSKIVVVCHLGSRAAYVSSLLQAIGFNNVTYLNGGLIQLVTQLTPKTVPLQ